MKKLINIREYIQLCIYFVMNPDVNTVQYKGIIYRRNIDVLNKHIQAHYKYIFADKVKLPEKQAEVIQFKGSKIQWK